MPERVVRVLLFLLVALLPFELRFAFGGLSNLQWIFVLVAIAAVRVVAARWRDLVRDRLVLAAAVFVAVQWISALTSGDLLNNSVKAAVRYTSGFGLFMIILALSMRSPARESVANGPARGRIDSLLKIWVIAASAAAIYALLALWIGGLAWPFRLEEFYLVDVKRLSGTFEYPNTAAAFFAMSLPLVWWAPLSTAVRLCGTALLWTALILTYSRGALVAVGGVALIAGFVSAREWYFNRGVIGNTDQLRSVALFVILGLALSALASLVQPAFAERLTAPPDEKPLAAEYHPNFNLLRHRPGEITESTVTLRNAGALRWEATGERQIVLSYHWFDINRREILEVAPLETVLSTNVEPGDSVTVRARFQTPDRPGWYLLDWDLSRKNYGWFTKAGVYPGIVEAEIEAGAGAWFGHGDVSRWYRPDRPNERSVDASILRPRLWTAAMDIWKDHPVLGAGPDSFRLLYGRYLGYTRWDEKIRANNSYLELLSTGGILGLVNFAIIVLLIPWRWDPVSLSLGVFLIHGFVDVFLMTTPLYFGFWLLVGLSRVRHLRSLVPDSWPLTPATGH